jgi:hypothetical protein
MYFTSVNDNSDAFLTGVIETSDITPQQCQ